MRRLHTGFTLIEILVVVFIIGIILGFASLNLGGRALDDKVEEEARRLRQLFSLARDEASVTGLELGWRLEDGSYQFLALAETGWVPYPQRGPLRPRQLAPFLRLDLRLDQQPVSSDEKALLPQIMFLSSGELTPFEMTMSASGLDAVFRLTGNYFGEISLERYSRDDASLPSY